MSTATDHLRTAWPDMGDSALASSRSQTLRSAFVKLTNGFTIGFASRGDARGTRCSPARAR